MPSLALLVMLVADPAPDASAWTFAGKVATILLAALGAVGLFIGRSVSRAIWRAHLKDCGADMKALLDELYSEDIAARDGAVRLVGVHEDRLDFLEAALKEQGKALAASLTDAIAAQTRAMSQNASLTAEALREINRVVEKIHDETAANSTALASVLGYLEGKEAYLGPERRAPRLPRDRKPK